MESALLAAPRCDVAGDLLWSGKSLASALLLGSWAPSTEGVITWISQQSSYAWFFRLTQFETLFLGLVLLQVFILRWLQILPLNLNKFFEGDPTGKRKRRSLIRQPELLDDDDMAISMFSLLRKLDDEECLLKALCCLESERLTGHVYPQSTRQLLSILLSSGKRSGVVDENSSADRRVEEKQSPWGLRTFQLAVLRGHEDRALNGTVCERRYSGCSMSAIDIVHYVDIISNADML